jgi:hypothetical protein
MLSNVIMPWPKAEADAGEPALFDDSDGCCHYLTRDK